MSQEFHTVERAAELLQLHPKTVLRLIREGRLRATKIGKSYRLLRSDLETFAGAPSVTAAPSDARVTCIAELPDLTREEASRMASILQACLIGQTARPDPIRIDTAYDPDSRHLKVVIAATLADAAALLKTLDAMLGERSMTAVFKSDAAAREVQACYRALLERWPIPNMQLRLPTRQGETFVLVCGPEDAPPVVLLHGSQANTSVWMFDAMLWSKNFRLYAIDMIGEPGLSAPSRPPLASEAYALWLDDVMAGLGLDSAAVVGVSLGGWLALDYAIRRPGRVRKMALVCPAGVGRQKNFLVKALPLLLLGPWGLRKMREMVFGPTLKVIPDAARPLFELMALVGRSVKPRVEKLPVFSDAALKALNMPILAILGGRDVLLDSEELRRRLIEHAPRAEVLFLPQARHAIFGQTGTIHEFLLKDSPERV